MFLQNFQQLGGKFFFIIIFINKNDPNLDLIQLTRSPINYLVLKNKQFGAKKLLQVVVKFVQNIAMNSLLPKKKFH